MERVKELQYIFSFVDEGCFDTELACNQLRSLWTAYCLHYGLNARTREYDSDLLAIWTQVDAVEGDTASWSDCDSFDNFMCIDLV